MNDPLEAAPEAFFPGAPTKIMTNLRAYARLMRTDPSPYQRDVWRARWYGELVYAVRLMLGPSRRVPCPPGPPESAA